MLIACGSTSITRQEAHLGALCHLQCLGPNSFMECVHISHHVTSLMMEVVVKAGLEESSLTQPAAGC